MPAPDPPVVVVAPDSFKGSLDANAACEAIVAGLRRVWPSVQAIGRPMADGGEGTLAAVIAAAGARAACSELTVAGAHGAPTRAAYGLLTDGEMRTAVIEIAQVVGITDASAMAMPVAERSTRGVGQLIGALLDRGIRRFMIGLGGSSTNDGGAGLLAALGLGLRDAAGATCPPTPAGLATLAVVDAGAFDARVRDCDITIMSDVNNPLCGEGGATAVFGPQKGVLAEHVAAIDRTLARFAAKAEHALGRSAAGNAGAGAAGGLGFALQLVGGRFASGAEVVADLIGLDAALAQADWAITGEGRTDAQTLLGKTPSVVAQHAARAGVPVTLLSGAVDASALPELARTFAGCFTLPAGPATLDHCIADAAPLLADRAEAIGRVVDAARRMRPGR